MEVGEYIRTTDGRIGKIEAITKRDEYSDIFHTDINCDDYECKHYVYDFDIKSHSKNIIDLIETGDIVNGWKVGFICYGEKEGVKHTINFELEDGQPYSWKEKFGEETCDFQLKIETILTHEMYEQNCYKIGE